MNARWRAAILFSVWASPIRMNTSTRSGIASFQARLPFGAKIRRFISNAFSANTGPIMVGPPLPRPIERRGLFLYHHHPSSSRAPPPPREPPKQRTDQLNDNGGRRWKSAGGAESGAHAAASSTAHTALSRIVPPCRARSRRSPADQPSANATSPLRGSFTIARRSLL
jgi:hypothetical protein